MCIESVPEHSLPLMTAMSGGQSLVIDGYQFYHAKDWLLAIGYPLAGRYDVVQFDKALNSAIAQTGAKSSHAIAPILPESLQDAIVARDRYYVLGTDASLPKRLKNPVQKAAQNLKVTETSVFTPKHRKLWNEFLAFRGSSGKMASRVTELYLRTPKALELCKGDLRLLDAWDAEGNLVASLLLDYAPENFVSYILGAHSRKFAVAHAMDLLFWQMIQNAKSAHKRYIHLGLGVNEGILRFKVKWGGKPSHAWQMASWDLSKSESQEQPESLGLRELSRNMAFAILRGNDKSARQILSEGPQQSPFAMIWEVEKNGKLSWILGTAHFFCRSFEASFRRLYKKANTVLFEGPLDNGFMTQVEAAGKLLPPGKNALLESLSEEELKKLEKIVNGGTSIFQTNRQPAHKVDVRHLLGTGNYWYAFFTLWTKFLENQGWKESVDMEAWRVAQDMGLKIIGMESLEEQLESLSSLPRERVINFFHNCANWKAYARQNKNAYLAGDLEKMMGSSAEFPTRTEHVVGRRDQRFRERMRPWLEEGGCAVFVGCAHMVNLRHMLKEDGFDVRQKPFGLWPKLHLAWRNLKRPDDGVVW